MLVPNWVSGQTPMLPLEDVLSEIGEDHQAHFVYAGEELKEMLIASPEPSMGFNEKVHAICVEHNLEFEFVRPKVVMIREKKLVSESEDFVLMIQIVDADTKDYLPSALMVSEDKKHSYVSDESGMVRLKEGGQCYVVHYLGYEKAFFCPADLEGNIPVYQLVLRPVSFEAGVVELGTMPSVSVQDSRNYLVSKLDRSLTEGAGNALGIKDPLRGLQALSGVANFGEHAADLEVRGGKSDENLILFNGLTLYSVEHYFGLFSNINDQLCDELSFYKEIIPPWFGGYASSVVDIRSLPSADETSGELELSNLLFNGRMDWKISDRWSTSLSFRSTVSNLADSDYLTADRGAGLVQLLAKTSEDREILLSTESSSESSFLDGYGAVRYQWSDRAKLTAHAFVSKDHYSNEIIQKRNLRRPIAGISDQEEWNNQAYGLQWNQEWSAQLRQRTQLSYSKYDLRMEKGYKTRDPGNSDSEFDENYSNFSEVEGYRFSSHWNHSLGIRASVDFGAELISEQSLFSTALRRREVTRLDTGAVQYVIFSGYNGKLGPLNLNAGLRANYYNLLNAFHFDPRVSINYDSEGGFSVGGSVGIVHQFVRKIYFEMPSGRNTEYYALANGRQVPVLKAEQISLWSQWILGDFKSKISLYKKDYDGVVEQAAQIVGVINQQGTTFRNEGYRFFRGTGRNIGLEWSNSYHFKTALIDLNYTWSKNTVSYPRVDQGADIPSSNDRRHQLTLMYDWKLPKSWSFNLQYNFASGLPFTDISRFLDRPRDRGSESEVYRQDRLSDYHRLDIGVSKSWMVDNMKWSLSAHLYNVTDRQNVFYEEYYYAVRGNDRDPAVPRNFILGYQQDLLGITPSIRMSVEW